MYCIQKTSDLIFLLPILVTLMMEAIPSSEASVLTEPHGLISQETTLLMFFLFTKILLAALNSFLHLAEHSQLSLP
jgi:hypothetical protein